MLVRIIAGLVALLAACAHPQQHSPGQQYFAWANLYLEPPVPSNPITKEQADGLAAGGNAFYVGEYNGLGELDVLKKVYQGNTVVIWRPTRTEAIAPAPR
jgi:hypothetical protein